MVPAAGRGLGAAPASPLQGAASPCPGSRTRGCPARGPPGASSDVPQQHPTWFGHPCPGIPQKVGKGLSRQEGDGF